MGTSQSFYSSSLPKKIPVLRKPIRNVNMEILCLGLPRTGTASLRAALRDLSYGDVYHFSTVYREQPEDAVIWTALLRSSTPHASRYDEDWDSLLGNCMALTDIPCVIFYKGLLERYPSAKVILTVRDDADQWWASFRATVFPWFRKIYQKYPDTLIGRIKRMFHQKTAVETMSELIDKNFIQPKLVYGGKKFYESYYQEICKIVPRERLLVYNVKEGWAPLCEFLGRKSPQKDFPNLNGRDSFPSMFTDGQDVW